MQTTSSPAPTKVGVGGLLSTMIIETLWEIYYFN